MGDSHYGFSLTTFSPSGKLVQIEYALKAVEAGGPVVGVKGTEGVVLAAEHKMPSTLYEPDSVLKCAKVSDWAGLSYAGMGPDFRLLLAAARKAAVNYKLAYGEDVPPGRLVEELAELAQRYTQSGGVRPFGVSLLLGGWDSATASPALYQIDPSGAHMPWKATALGTNAVNAKTFLEKRYSAELGLDDAIHLALLTLKESFDQALTKDNVQLAVIDAQGFRLLSPDQLKDHIGAL